MNPGITIETLIPDFQGKWENLSRIVEARPEIVSHNLETVRRLTKLVRVQAKYDRSLEVLKRLGDAGVTTKSGIMLGLGERTTTTTTTTMPFTTTPYTTTTTTTTTTRTTTASLQ